MLRPRHIVITGAVALLFSISCLERVHDSACPSDKPFATGGLCFIAPPDALPLDAFAGDAFDGTPICHTSTDCPSADKPICVSHLCQACTVGTDDQSCHDRNAQLPRCGTAGVCVACTSATQDVDCPSASPICGSGATCRGCQANSECSTGVCLLDGMNAGSCALSSTIAYVDNRGGVAACKVAHPTATGKIADPFCDIADGVTTQLPYVVVAGAGSASSPAPYTALSLNGRTVRLIGPGRLAAPTALVAGSLTADAIAISGASNVQIEGLEITAAGGTHAGVSCGSGATLTLRSSFVHANGGAGVSTSGCNATLDANLVTSNSLGGVQLTGGTCAVTNTLISGNGSSTDVNAFGGFAIDRTTTLSAAAFLTVYKNHVTSGVGGIDCGSGTGKPILDSVVWGNDSAPLGAQCMGTSVISGTGTSPTAPVFTTDGHLQANTAANTACCVDKISSPTTPNANHDVDGARRPQGATGNSTIGANELAQ